MTDRKHDSDHRSPEARQRRRIRLAERERCREAIATAHPETYLPIKQVEMEREGNPRAGTNPYRRARARAMRRTVDAHRDEYESLRSDPPAPKLRHAAGGAT